MDREQISKAVKAIGKWTILPSEFYEGNPILLIDSIEKENINYLSQRIDNNRVILMIFEESIYPFYQTVDHSNV